METKVLDDQESQEIELLEKYLPALSDRSRVYLKGMTEALLYAQEGICAAKVEQPVLFPVSIKLPIKNYNFYNTNILELFDNHRVVEQVYYLTGRKSS